MSIGNSCWGGVTSGELMATRFFVGMGEDISVMHVPSMVGSAFLSCSCLGVGSIDEGKSVVARCYAMSSCPVEGCGLVSASEDVKDLLCAVLCG